MDFLNSDFFKLILSSVVVVALITSFFNYFISRKINARLIEIEGFKRKSELETYRYTNIFEAIKEINSLPAISYNYLKRDESGNMGQDRELFGKVVEQTTDRHSKVMSVYDRISPLIDSNLTYKVDAAKAEADTQSNLLTESIYANKPLPKGVDVATLMQARQIVESEINKAMKQQISILTANSVQNS